MPFVTNKPFTMKCAKYLEIFKEFIGFLGDRFSIAFDAVVVVDGVPLVVIYYCYLTRYDQFKSKTLVTIAECEA